MIERTIYVIWADKAFPIWVTLLLAKDQNKETASELNMATRKHKKRLRLPTSSGLLDEALRLKRKKCPFADSAGSTAKLYFPQNP